MSDKYIRQEENIKDCPFCGCSVSVERVPLKHYKGCVIFEIKCSNCGCERALTKNDSIYRTEEEARANAIAQWNERSSAAADPHKMSAREYERILRRMEKTQPMPEELYLHGKAINHGEIDKAISIVEKWAREHPEEVINESGK